MSLLNVWLSPQRALVAVDTETCNLHTGEYAQGSKMLALPHAGAIVASRGHNVFLSSVFALAMQRGDVVDYDSLAALMPKMLPTAFEFIYAGVRDLPAVQRDAVIAQQLVIVGHSRSLGRMCGMEFLQQDVSQGFIGRKIDDPGYVAPWVPAWGYAPDIDTHEGMELLARLQVFNVNACTPAAPIGGRLLLAQVSADGIAFSSVCQLTDRNGAAPMPVGSCDGSVVSLRW